MLEFIAKKFLMKKPAVLHGGMDEQSLEEMKKITRQFQDHAEVMAAVFSASQRGDEIVYIADMDTYDVLWANEKTIQMFGPVIGKQCYQALQGFSEPCAFCTNDKIAGGRSFLWTYHNPVVNRDYFIKDMGIYLGNRIVRYEIAYDITGMNLFKV